MLSQIGVDGQIWARLSPLLDQAVDLPLEERAAWLAALPAEYAGLKALLQQLLADHATAGTGPRLLSAPQLQSMPVTGAAGSGPACRDGDMISGYRLLRRLGSGGMGEVWLAERRDGLIPRPVALKLPLAQGARQDLADRMAREREILARLNHPHIARLYDAGLDAEGRPFLALEFVAGAAIDAFCSEHRLRIEARLRLLLQVAQAVAHAHANLVVHRDLKPANILVTDSGQVRLLDFGIAKLLGADAGKNGELTQQHGRALTLHYASPEQILNRPIGTASDVYSLGVVMYELLCGQSPYRLRRDSRAALEDAIVHDEPLRPSVVAGDARLRRQLRGDLDTIVLKALKKDAAERYATVDALALDIEHWLHHRPVLARPDSGWYRTHKFVVRHKLGAAAAAVVMLAVLAGGGVAAWQANVARAQAQRAVEVKNFIASIFGDANPWQGPQARPSQADLLARAHERVNGATDLDTTVRLELLIVIASSYIGLQLPQQAEKIVDQLVAEGTRRLGAEHELTLQGRSIRARVMRRLGRTGEMRADVEAVLAVLQRDPDKAPKAMLDALINRAQLEMEERHNEQAEQTARSAMDLLQRHRGAWSAHEAQAQHAWLLELVALSLEDRQLFGEAVAWQDRALAGFEAAFSDQPKHPQLVRTRLLHARMVGRAGDVVRATALLQRAIAEASDIYGEQSFWVGRGWHDMARFQLRLGDLGGARRSLEAAVPALRATALQQAYVGSALHTLGQVALAMGDPALALGWFQRSIESFASEALDNEDSVLLVRAWAALAQAHLGEAAPALAELRRVTAVFKASNFAGPYRVLGLLGEAQRLAGDFDAALATQAEALALIGDDPALLSQRLPVQREIGLAEVERGHFGAAIAALEQALAGLRAQQPHATPERADVLVGLGRAHIAMGSPALALPLLQEADQFWRGFDASTRGARDAGFWLHRCHELLGSRAQAGQAPAGAAAANNGTGRSVGRFS